MRRGDVAPVSICQTLRTVSGRPEGVKSGARTSVPLTVRACSGNGSIPGQVIAPEIAGELLPVGGGIAELQEQCGLASTPAMIRIEQVVDELLLLDDRGVSIRDAHVAHYRDLFPTLPDESGSRRSPGAHPIAASGRLRRCELGVDQL